MGKIERKHYDAEFKQGAVRLVVEEGKTAVEAARDLGINYCTLKNWLYAYEKHKGDAFPGQGNLRPEDQKIRELEKKLRRAEMERDLLKKTIALLGELDRRNITL